jgi:type IV secretory pathway VirJ component
MGARTFSGFAIVWLVISAAAYAQPPAGSGERMRQRRLRLPIGGIATAYIPDRPPDAIVLFVSGDGGWNLGVVDMARRIATHSIVVGVSFPAIRRSVAGEDGCWYAAGDLEVIARNAEKQLGLLEYRPPILVGYSSGATLVYAALAGAPAGTFAGAVSLGFCPDLEVARPVCAAHAWKPAYDDRKHVSWLPRQTSLPGEWYLLHGVQDQVCRPAETRAFVNGMAGAHLIQIDGTGHGFSRPAQWGPELDAAVAALLKPTPVAAAPIPASAQRIAGQLQALDLPLELSIPRAPRAFLVFVSGDGGWAALDRGVADALRRDDIAVVGLSAIRYFWRAKTPGQVAMDLRRVVQVLEGAGKPVAAGGYSMGAEVVPVALAAAQNRPRLAGVVAIAPAQTASFEIDPLDWIRTPGETAFRVAPALGSLGIPVLCVRPVSDAESACGGLSPGIGEVVTLPGSHHFDGRYGDVAAAIERFVTRISAPVRAMK